MESVRSFFLHSKGCSNGTVAYDRRRVGSCRVALEAGIHCSTGDRPVAGGGADLLHRELGIGQTGGGQTDPRRSEERRWLGRSRERFARTKCPKEIGGHAATTCFMLRSRDGLPHSAKRRDLNVIPNGDHHFHRWSAQRDGGLVFDETLANKCVELASQTKREIPINVVAIGDWRKDPHNFPFLHKLTQLTGEVLIAR